MKIHIPIFFISLIIGIHCKCLSDNSIEFPTAEECFGRSITTDEIEGSNPDDFLCCYLKSSQNSISYCFPFEKSKKDKIHDLYASDNSGDEPYALGCSLDQLPDESKSDSCYLDHPIKKENCFTRSISSEEKLEDQNSTPNKCCYVEFSSENYSCDPLDETKIDEYINIIKQEMQDYGEDPNGLKVICSSPSSSKSNQRFVRVNNILFLLISLILL